MMMNTSHSQLCRALLHPIKVTEPRYHQGAYRFERATRAKKKKAYICLEMGIVARPKRTFLFFGTDLAGPVRQEDV